MTTKTKAVPPEDRAWTVTDVAYFLKVSVRHVYNLRTSDRTFPEPVKVGTALRWPPRAVPSWLECGGAVLPPNTSSPKQRKGAGRVH
jgi:predicted DNA-binding transcriptional regulator AlpA